MLAATRSIVAAGAVLIALPLFFAGFLVAPLVVVAGGLLLFALTAPD